MRSLVVGDWVVARCDDGSLEAEYALFAASDVLLSRAAGSEPRELGYLTTAGIARERLRDAGVTPELCRAAFEALGPARDLALAPPVARAAAELDACEAFQGGVFCAASRSYAGAWLDLDAVARACSMPDAALAMQLVHLALVVDEASKSAPVRLLADGAPSAPGHRTWRPVAVEVVRDLPRVLREARRPFVVTPAADEVALCEARVRELEARAGSAAAYRPRLHAIASTLARAVRPPSEVVLEEAAYEPTPLVDELRAHADMLARDVDVREVAQFLGQMASAGAAPAALAVLAARAWLASGETAYARYFARRALEDAAAPDGARLAARELLDSTAPTNESMRPPAVRPFEPTPVVAGEPPRTAPPGASLPPTADVSLPPPPLVPSLPRLARVAIAEIVETMTTPSGDAARERMTELARSLARDYRLAYGVTLKTDVAAVETLQRIMRRRFPAAAGDARAARKLEAELTRCGALLSEILARNLGAYWLDTSSAEVGRWAMVVPPRTRVWPVGRVYRFFQRGRLEDDLVTYYAGLERASRAK